MGRVRRWFTLVVLVATLSPWAAAHEVRPCYLQITQTGEETYDVLWKVPAKGDLRLGLYVRFAEGTEETREHVGRFEGGAYLDRWGVRRAGGLDDTTVGVDGLRATLTDVLVRVERLERGLRPFQDRRRAPGRDEFERRVLLRERGAVRERTEREHARSRAREFTIPGVLRDRAEHVRVRVRCDAREQCEPDGGESDHLVPFDSNITKA